LKNWHDVCSIFSDMKNLKLKGVKEMKKLCYLKIEYWNDYERVIKFLTINDIVFSVSNSYSNYVNTSREKVITTITVYE
jgi:hypothetical protein